MGDRHAGEQLQGAQTALGEWVVTRRDVLKASGFAIAGLAVGAPFVCADETNRKPELRFGIVTDAHYADTDTRGSRHYRASKPKMTECVSLMNEQQVDFLVELGDLKDEGKPAEEKRTLAFLETIEKVFGKFKGPRYHVLGNHDMDSISKAQFWARAENTGIARGASYYSFDAKGLHFVVLDANYTSEGADYDRGNFTWTDTNIPQEQCDWLSHDLASTSKPVIVFVHQLLDGEDNHCINNATQVREVLQESQKVLAVFHGHNHAGRYSQIEGIHYYTLKAMVEGDGEENNAYAVVDVYEDRRLVVTGYRKAMSVEMANA